MCSIYEATGAFAPARDAIEFAEFSTIDAELDHTGIGAGGDQQPAAAIFGSTMKQGFIIIITDTMIPGMEDT